MILDGNSTIGVMMLRSFNVETFQKFLANLETFCQKMLVVEDMTTLVTSPPVG